MADSIADRRAGLERSYKASGNLLVRELTGPLREIARSRVGDREAAEDIVNETFHELFVKRPDAEDLEALLRTMVRRRAIDWLRRERQRQRAERRSIEHTRAGAGAPPEELLSIWTAVARLPVRAAVFLVTLYVLGASESEAALAAGYAESSAKKVRTRSLSALRRLLRPDPKVAETR